MAPSIWTVVIPAAFAVTGVVFTALTAKRKNEGDARFQMIAVLQAERVTADARADKAETRAEASDRKAKRAEVRAWKYHQQILRAGLEPDPEWPATDETRKVTA